jgi:hypothetical protein
MISQVKSVKITAQNLKSIVLDGSKKVQELEKKKQFTRERLEEKRLQEEEEKALEKRTKKIQKPKKEDKPKKISAGNFFDKVLQAGGLILVGILVNAAEKIFEVSMNVLNTISEIVQNIVSGFRLIYAFFTGDFNNDEYANDKERVDKMLGDAQSEIDKIAGEDTLIGGFIKTVKPLVDLVINAFRDNLQGKKTKEGETIEIEGVSSTSAADQSGGLGARDTQSEDQLTNLNSSGRSTRESERSATYTDDSSGFAAGTSKSIIEIGKNLGAAGFAVSEHPDFTKDTSGGRYTPGKGYVSNVHKGAGHYDGRALDVTDWRGSLEDSKARYRSVLDDLYKDRKKLGIKMLIHDSWGAFYGQAHSYTKNDRLGPGDHGHPVHMHIESIHGGTGDSSGKPAHKSYGSKEGTGSGPEFVGAKRVIPELNKGRSGGKRTVIVQRQIVEKVVPVPVYQ